MAQNTITGGKLVDGGELWTGEIDPKTGKQYQKFTPYQSNPTPSPSQSGNAQFKNKITGEISTFTPQDFSSGRVLKDYFTPMDGADKMLHFPEFYNDPGKNPASATVPGSDLGLNNNTGISGNTEGLRDQYGALITDVRKAETESGLTQGSALDMARQARALTQQQLDAIENAGKAIEAQFNEEISKAERQKELGLGTSLVGAGQRGGLMSSQFVGQAARKQGETGWFGAAGKLENIKSAYDLNISSLQNQKTVAIQQAKEAARRAYEEGNVADFKMAQDLLKEAREASAARLDIIQKKANIEILIDKAKREAQTYTGDKEKAGFEKMIESGADLSSLSQAEKTKYEQALGLSAGMFDSVYAGLKDAQELKMAGNTADFTKKMAEAMSNIPEGQTVTIGGQTFTGTGSKKAGTSSSSMVNEYEYYANQEKAAGRTPKSFEQYQNEDANRKDTSSRQQFQLINGEPHIFDPKTGSLTKIDTKETIGSGQFADTSRAATQLNLIKTSLENAEKLAHRSGSATIWEKVKRGIGGSTEFSELVAETNTLRTNILALMTDPDIKKFFGPQMSNADVQLMTSTGTTLNPELQGPEKMKSELARLKGIVNKLVVPINPEGNSSSNSTAQLFDDLGN